MNAEHVIRLCLEALIKTHGTPKLLRAELDSKALDRRMEWLTPAVFDPNGRCAALIAARDWLAWAEEVKAE